MEPAVPIMGVMSRVVILVAAGSTQCACVVSEASVLYVACALVSGAVPAYAMISETAHAASGKQPCPALAKQL